ncbi:3'-5' exoribonuclease [Natranaerovirga pectinivora]|uniref:3'-5' exoribonuclease n=1 Tax=Natranaerovirga pectinivora TaxID=682400 RepID=A0A4R3MGG1_9FIRM|nr:HD domain-containing protein [Natranaerovirga pectinivora]TCT12187.1 3'-5' exoribonuclease [Natranaerovirga pectinivora]
MYYISELREGDQVVEHYLCKQKQVLKTRAGKSYYSLKLQDKTGCVDAKVWDLNTGIDDFNENEYIKVEGQVLTFQSSLQLSLRRIRRSQEGEYDPKEYIPTSSRNIEEMYSELKTYIDQIKEPSIKKLTEKFFVEDKDFISRFKAHSAAKTMHHSYMGGLLEHTLCILNLCEFYAKQYPIINTDILYASALFHDIGKMSELSGFPENDYTDEGQLLGHIIIVLQWIDEKIKEIPNFSVKIANHIKHCIISHHGQLEYGSPKKPQTIEALALHFADNTDAKLRTFTELLSNSDEDGPWIGWQKIFDSNIRKTTF